MQGLPSWTRTVGRTPARAGVAALVIAGLSAGWVASAAEASADRGYELVSAPERAVNDVARVPMIAEDGDTVAYLSLGATDDATGPPLILGAAVARRGGSGWQSSDANPPSREAITNTVGTQGNIAFSTDFSKTLVSTNAPLMPDDLDNYWPDLYLFDRSTSAVTEVTAPVGAPNTGAENFAFIGGVSPDLSRVAFEMNNGPLLPGASNSGVYVHDASGLRLASVLPDGTPAPSPGVVAPVVIPAAHGGVHATSDDVQRVYFYDSLGASDRPNLNKGTMGTLYVYDGDHSVAVSASRRISDGGTMALAIFLAASHDGSVAYFASVGQLTDDAPPGGGIYRFDLGADTLTLLTPNPALAGAGSPNVSSAAVSDDLSHIYFISTAALDAGAIDGSPNLYVWTADGTRFIETVGGPDVVARVSRDGRYALLTSTSSLRGAPTNGRNAVYEYDDASGDLVCVSCRADGSASGGDATLFSVPRGYPAAAEWTRTRNITDDGRVFFTTTDRLVAGDVGGGADVYEYDHGQLSLISSGTSDSDSYLADNTDDGRDVFFLTRSRLTGHDPNTDGLDLYDARIGGGFLEPAPPRPACDEDCQGGGPASPGLLSPGSATSQGAGNVVPVSPKAKSKAKRSIRLARLTAADRRRLARGGAVQIAVRVTGGGRVLVTARRGSRGSALGVATRTIRTKASVTAHLRLRLSRQGRRALAANGKLRLTIEAKLKGAAETQRTTATLISADR